ncbi:hypothetical protein C8D77_1319 [Mesorhizobium loti]|uniref:Amidohydrolase n=1 Tax=Rhizobium loti TaxID=381 RepID=A0A8E2W7B1_RHILI|nr:hypothetical protein C8D77_1319 [Mesorhizobium loti]
MHNSHLADEIIAWRRHLHLNPELDFDMHETTRFVRSWRPLESTTSKWGHWHSSVHREGPTIHACGHGGHGGHTAMLGYGNSGHRCAHVPGGRGSRTTVGRAQNGRGRLFGPFWHLPGLAVSRPLKPTSSRATRPRSAASDRSRLRTTFSSIRFHGNSRHPGTPPISYRAYRVGRTLRLCHRDRRARATMYSCPDPLRPRRATNSPFSMSRPRPSRTVRGPTPQGSRPAPGARRSIRQGAAP